MSSKNKNGSRNDSNKILVNNVRFGPKQNNITPSGQGDLSLTVIFGALAKGLFDGFGKIGINSNPSDILSQINNKPSLISTLKTTNNKLNELKSSVVEIKNSLNKIKSSIDSINIEPFNMSGINVSIDNIDELTNKLKSELKHGIDINNLSGLESISVSINNIDELTNKLKSELEQGIDINNLSGLESISVSINNIDDLTNKLKTEIEKGIDINNLSGLESISVSIDNIDELTNKLKSEIEKGININNLSGLESISVSIDNIDDLTNKLKSELEQGIDINNLSGLESISVSINNIDDITNKLKTEIEKGININNLSGLESISVSIDNIDDLTNKLKTEIEKGIDINNISIFTNNILNLINELKTINNTLANTNNILSKNDLFKGLEKIDTLDLKINLEKSGSDVVKLIHDIIDLVNESNNINLNENGFEKLINIIGGTDNENSLEKVFNNINTLIESTILKGNNKNVNPTNIKMLSNILELITSILNINDVNTKNLRKLVLITSPGQSIDKIFNNIKKLGKQDLVVNKNIDIIKDIFETLTIIMDIDANQRRRIKNNTTFIYKHIIDVIKGILLKVEEINSSDKDLSNSIKNLNLIFNSIVNITEIDKLGRNKTRRNINYIKDFIIPSIVEIINEINEVSNKSTKDGYNSIDNVNKLFESLYKLGDFNFKELIKLRFKSKLFKYIIKTDILGILNDISMYNISNDVFNILDNLYKFYDNLNILLETINQIDLGFATGRLSELRTFTLPLLNSIINYYEENLNKEINVNCFNKFIKIFDSIKNIYFELSQIKFNELNNYLNDIVLVIDLLNKLPEINGNYNLSGFNKYKNLISALKILELSEPGYDLNLKRILENTTQLNNILYSINEAIDIWPNDLSKPTTLKNFFKSFDVIKDKLSPYADLELVTTSGIISDMNSILVALQSIVITLSKFKGTESLDISNVIDNVLVPIIESFTPTGNIGKNLNEIQNLDTSKLENIENFSKVIDNLIKLSKKSNGINSNAFKGLSNAVEHLKEVINKFSEIDEKDVNKADVVIKGIMLLIAGSAATLLFSAFVMKYIDLGDLLSFTVVLGTFLFGVTKIIQKIGKHIESDIDTMEAISYFIAACGGILLFGGLIMKFINFSDLLLFGLGLTIFVGGITLVINKLGDTFNNKEILDNLYVFSESVAILGGILLAGSLISKILTLEDIGTFIGSLAAFIGGITVELFLLNKIFGSNSDLLKSLYDFSKAVAITSAVLIFGALIANHIPFESIVLFGVMLMTFISMITLPFLLFKKLEKDVFYAMKDFAILVGICSAIMLIGANFVSSNLIINSLIFAVALGTFITIITWAFKLSAKSIKTSIASALALVVLISLSTAMLWIGSEIIEHNPDFFKNSLLFVLGLGLFLGGMGAIMWLLGKLINNIAIGMLAIVGIIAITALATTLVLFINEFDKHTSWENIISGVFKIFGVIAVVGAAIIGVGELMVGTVGIAAGLLIAGTAAVILIGVVTFIAAYTIKELIKATNNVDFDNATVSVNKMFDVFDVITQRMIKLYTGDGFWGGIKKFAKLTAAIKTYKEIGEMLGTIAQGIQYWANMNIPIEFDKKGRPTKYTHISDSQISLMGDNIGKVITAIGKAIIEVYDSTEGKEIFEKPILGLGGDSPFQVIVKAMTKTGSMLSSIAKAVQMWANLRIPDKFDKNGNPTHYISITEKDLNKLPTNIQNVLTAIGSALVATVRDDKNKDIFADSLGKNAPAIVAAKAMKLMGETLNLTAQVVGAYASGDFPIIGKDGKLTNVHIDDIQLFMAGYKINAILTCIGNAIKNTVNNPQNKDIFNDGMLKDAPAMVAAKAINQMASALNTIITVLGKFKDLKLEDLKLDDTKTKIDKIVKWSCEVLLIFTKPAENPSRGGIGGWFHDLFSGDQTVGDYINENLPDMEDAIKGINKIGKHIIDVVKTLNELGKQIASNNLSVINQNNKKVLITKINLLIEMQNIITTIGSNELSKVNRYIKYDDKVVNVVKKIIEIVRKYDELIKLINNSKSINKSKLDNFFTLSKTVNNIAQSLNINYGKTNSKHFDLLCEGLKKIYSTFNEFEETKGFKSYANDVSKFIEKINSLDLNKLSQMNSLIKSMNELTSKMNGLDKLSEALNDNLTLVLRELLYQLQKAEASINNAHKLQEKRKELIQDSIYKIKNIMDKHMIVEVYNKSDNTDSGYTASVNSTTISPNTGTNTDNTSTSSTNESISSTPELSSPENAGSTELPKNTESNKDEALTKDAFINLMRQHMKLWDA